MKKSILILFAVFVVSAVPFLGTGDFTGGDSHQSEKSIVWDINPLMKTIRKAHDLHSQAVKSYESGNNERAKEFYRESLRCLLSAELDAGMQYRLKEEFSALYSKLERLLSEEVQGYRTGKEYTIPIDEENGTVKEYIKIYTEGAPKKRINEALERSGMYREMILGVLKEYNLPGELVYLPVVESLYDINNLSCAGALGLWQLMPHRARALGLKVNYWIDERKDPEKSTRAAARYLKDLYIMFDDWHLALSAYNRGENGLGRDLEFSKATNIAEMSSRKAVPKETEKFVPKFMVCTLIGDNTEKYGFKPEYMEPASCDEVEINDIIDLEIIAECAGIKVGEMRKLNPSLLAWCTPPNYPGFKLKLPEGTKDIFLENIAKVEDLNPSRGYVKYRVKKGDCLSRIAKEYCTKVGIIKEDNKLRSAHTLQINQVLLIRPGKKYFTK